MCIIGRSSLSFLTLTWFVLSPLAGAELGSNTADPLTVVVNELMAQNNGSLQDSHGDYDDWIELYNYGDDAVDVGGCYLTDEPGDATKWQVPVGQPAVTTIAGGGYLLIWADGEPQEGPLHASFKLAADGETVALYDPLGGLIDSIDFAAQGDDASFGRFPDGGPSWRVFETPTPGASNTLAAGDIVISEIMYHPSHPALTAEDTRKEWIELSNKGAESVRLAGWAFVDGIEFVLPDVVLGAGEYLVVAADVDAFSTGHAKVTNVVGGWTGWLSNSGERIVLENSAGVIVDAVTYTDQGDWATRELGPPDMGHRGWQWSGQTDGGGKSLELIVAAMPNGYGQNWAASQIDGGTPGSANSVAADDIAPMILEVQHGPLIPGPNDAVTVTARIIDESIPSVAVWLQYRVDRSTYTGIDSYPRDTGGFIALPMFDDGDHGDGAAGDGLYGARILPHKDGDIIEFYVEAIDHGRQTRTWPAPSLVDDQWLQVTNALYRVDAHLDVETYWQIGGQPLYYLIMTEMERGRLAYIGLNSGNDGPDSQMNGTFISLDGTGAECRYRAGIRNRGHGTRRGRPNNYHVNFPHDDPWKDVGAVNFNARYTHAQIIGSALFHMAGIPAADTTAAQVRVNGADLAYAGSPMYGSYVRLETFDDSFAQRHFPNDPDGNLYTCFRTTGGVEAELRYEGPDPNAYRNRYFKANHVAQDDWSDLIHLVDVLNNAPEDTYLQEVSEVINLPQWLRYIALDSLLLNYETGLNMGMGDDYFMYRGATDRRFVLVPHDLDTILDQGNSHGSIDQSIYSIVAGAPGRNGVEGLKRLFDHPDVAPLYHAQMLNLIETIFSPQRFDPLVDQVLGDWVPAPILDDIKQFAARRSAAVLAQIPRQLTIESALPVVNGYRYTPNATYTLSGTADAVKTRSVLVNGVLAAWSPREGRWQSGGVLGPADTLVRAGSEWKYLDDGSDPGETWRMRGFDDSGWPSGRAQLGYGDGDEATVVNSGPANSRYITTYFRRSFPVRGPSQYLALRLRLLRDDGAVVYLNGVEVWRVGMPDGPIDYMTRATVNIGGQEEDTFLEYALSPQRLVTGANLLAVEIHQTSPTSGDISFDLALEAVREGEVEGTLLPGINRIVVQAFDGRDGAGSLLEQGYVDIWYDNDAGSEISGVLASDTVLATGAGPWYVTDTVTVPAGVTLTIEPGATLLFHPDTELVVNGRLVAEGAPYRRITLASTPGATGWAGLQFRDTQQESRLAYVNMEYADAGSQAIHADHASVYMDQVIWGNHTTQYLSFDDSSIVLKHCVLPGIEDNELVHFNGVPADGHALFEGNWFGTTTGYNDIIDFTGGQRPGPIARFIGNTFTGASDDCIDLDGADAHVEGNVFMHVHAVSPTSSSQSHAVTTGTANGQYSELTVVRNLFYDVDHAMLCKDGGFITAVNNTVVHATHAAVNMYEARSGQWQGKGFYGDGNIFQDVAHVFENPDWAGHPSEITMNNSMFPAVAGDPVVWAGAGNLEGVDPQFVNDANVTDPPHDLQLRPTSPGIGAGPNGRDMGATVPSGASISGEPFEVTWRTSVTLTVGGPDICAYKYRVNDGPWSQEVRRPAAGLRADPEPLPPIELTGLRNGQACRVAVLGKDSAGVWQDANSPTVSHTWIVDTSYRRLVINEVLALNASAVEHEGTFPDMVELYYDGPTAINLSGMSLSDDPSEPAKFVFPGGVRMNPGEYLVVLADRGSATSGLHLGFGLQADGDGVYLYDGMGLLVDSVEFGAQLADLSIGRVGRAGLWRLTAPTFGQPNVLQPLGSPERVRINEWLANERVLFPSDFIELYNPGPLPVALGGFHITDTAEIEPDRQRLDPLTFIAAGGYLVLYADGGTAPGHLGFKLSSGGEMIALFDAAFREIDRVLFGPQTTDVSQGRSPDGASQLGYFILPTPGLPNPGVPVVTATRVPVVAEAAAKRAIIPGSAGQIGDEWRSDVAFDDSTWLSASGPPGGVGFERSSGYESMISLDVEAQMYGRATTCYIRVPFRISSESIDALSELYLGIRYDDGFVAYLNGTEVGRAGFAGTPQWDSSADSSHEASAEAFDAVVDLSNRVDLLRPGDNLLAIHGLNASATSSDFVISVAIDGIVTELEGIDTYPYIEQLKLLDSLRVTELMYHDRRGDDLDYVELQNVGDAPLDLTGVRLTEGVEFTFPSMSLAAGQYVVVVDDLPTFRAEYGDGVSVAGEYAGRLSNGGETIILALAQPLQAAIMRFAYGDQWYAETDGGGKSLTIRNPAAAPATWSNPESWYAAEPTPGRR